jgi:hypothetical protein
LTVRASLEVGEQIYRATFGGRTDLTLDPGGDILSHPAGVNLTAEQTIYVPTYVSGTYYANARSFQSGGAGEFVATTDLTAPSSGAVADSASWMYTSSGIIGICNRTGAPVLIDGDYIANGYNDSESFTGRNTALHWLSGGGFVSRALWRKAGSISIAVSGDTGSAFSGVTAGTNTASFGVWPPPVLHSRSSRMGGTT